jgi:hypothetical protein
MHHGCSTFSASTAQVAANEHEMLPLLAAVHDERDRLIHVIRMARLAQQATQ